MKHYYKLIDPTFTPPVVTYWQGDPAKSITLLHLRGFVMPLGVRKPKNIDKIYEF